jgi:penicillin amidase
MRIVPFIISAVATTSLVVVLNMQLPSGGKKTPRLGYFLSPQHGFWQNAEPTDISFNDDIKISGIKGNVDVYFDERLVPHIYADNNADSYFIQGYIHAKFRLWQMEFQTYIAGGRLSEIIPDSVSMVRDKYFRRLGMVYGAEKTLKEMEAEPATRQACDSYTAGVNAYIKSLKRSEIPFEYKLLNYSPEPWTNMKTALFLKFMSWDLTGRDDDLTFSNAKNYFGYDDFNKLYPNVQDTLDPIIPKGTLFEKPSIEVKVPANIDSAYLGRKDSISHTQPVTPDKNNGSNNWAVGGSKTKSGRPILCNDPHLGLNLPSLWYEMQITTPEYSSYGASFPGSPAIIIGFNDSCAWGVTNAERDVKDFYEIKFKDSTMQEYWLDNSWKQSEFRTETIKVKDGKDVQEKMAMTVFGPVMFDNKYKSKSKDGKYYAVRWKAHDASNELRTFYMLNRMKSYADYVEAIATYQCPGQNFVFASKTGDIAIRQQGMFPAKWSQQGDFAMPGTDSSYMWQGYIPVKENPQMTNPERGFVSSANQQPVDGSYPYYLGHASNFPPYRGYIINRKLASMNSITPDDMKLLQTDNYNIFAEICRPVLLKYLDTSKLNNDEKKYLDMLVSWNLKNDANEKGATVFEVFWDSVEVQTWGDELGKINLPYPKPTQSSLIENFMKDSAFKFADNINTPDKKETIADVVLLAYQKAVKKLMIMEKDGKLEWTKAKDTYVSHYTEVPQLGRYHLNTGGGTHAINCIKKNHGPSWRMVVHMTDRIEAYGVYPGGQNGNPGSKYYDSFVDTWAAGRYYSIIFLKKQEARKDERMKWHISFFVNS